MSWLKFLLPVLAGAKLATAATCSVKTTTVANAASASALAQACRTFTGTIAIATGNTDPIDLSGIEIIKNGGIYVSKNLKLTSLTANDLTTISDGTFYLDNVPQLSTLVFPMLTSVDNLHWNSLASLYGWTLTSNISEATNVLVSDTLVSTLAGLNLKTVDTLYISNNNLLSSIDMQLTNITGGVTISQNGQNPGVSFPDLTTAVNLTFSGISSLDISSLKTVNQLLGVSESPLQKFAAPKLTTVGGLALQDNPTLTSVSAPQLSLIEGALTLTNDSSLTGTIAFPKVNMVRGAVKIVGSFTSVSLPSITNVRGAFSVISDKKIGNTCDPFDKEASDNTIQGTYDCHGATPSSSSTSSSGSSSGTDSGSSSSTSTGAAAHLDRTTPMIGGLLGLCLAILGML